MVINEKLNFMGDEYCNNLNKIFSSNIFPWYYNNHVAGENNDGKEFFFTHIIFDHKEKKVNSEKAFELIKPLLDKLKLSMADTVDTIEQKCLAKGVKLTEQ